MDLTKIFAKYAGKTVTVDEYDDTLTVDGVEYRNKSYELTNETEETLQEIYALAKKYDIKMVIHTPDVESMPGPIDPSRLNVNIIKTDAGHWVIDPHFYYG